jgi:hypothetical protein
MIILSHRGYWIDSSEQNREIAFRRSFDIGFGIETDLRDCLGEIVIAHDPPHGEEILFREVLEMMDRRNLPLALNVKANGISGEVKKLLDDFSHTNYFAFDMSIPDTVAYVERGMKIFTGMSDLLRSPVLLDAAHGVWLDAFNSDWYSASMIDELVSSGKHVCIVSAELHGREKMAQWDEISKCESLQCEKLMICTDYPKAASEYFS